MAAGPNSKIDVGIWDLQLRKEDIRQILVIVLAGMHKRLAHPGPRPQGMPYRRRLHEIWAGTDYVEDVHGVYGFFTCSSNVCDTAARCIVGSNEQSRQDQLALPLRA
jgi:hypothetical protein